MPYKKLPDITPIQKILIVFLVLFSCLLLGAWQTKFIFPGKRQLNVLLVTIDTLRADHVGCYGYKRATTPTIDRLAMEGTHLKAVSYQN